MILEAREQALTEQYGKGLKILTPNKMLKRFPIALFSTCDFIVIRRVFVLKIVKIIFCN